MRRVLFICIACVAALIIPTLINPLQAFAAYGSYSIDEISTDLAVETNGATHIIEQQIITFDNMNTGYIWYLHKPEAGESVRISGIRVAPVDTGGSLIGDWTRLQQIDVDAEEQGAHPGDSSAPSLRISRMQPWFSYSIGDGMVRCYFPVGEFQTYIIETDYTVSHRVRVFRDVGELYWRYANDSLPVDAREVNLHVSLPVPADAGEIQPGIDVVAWGHGPDGGTFEVGADGSASYHVDLVKRSNYAEAHIIFPSAWISNLAPRSANQFSETRRAEAIAEEAAWVDSSMREATWDNKVRVLFLAVAVIVIAVAVIAVVRHGRTPRSRRALIRAAATLAVVALGESLFFRESVTTGMLAIIAAIMAATSLALPGDARCEGDEYASGHDSEENHA